MITLYRDDDVTPLDGFTLTNVEAGADSDAVEFHAWNTGGTEALNPLMVMRTTDPLDPNALLSFGVAPQDEQWGRMRIVGYDNTGDTSWSVQNTDWMPVGSYGGVLATNIPDECAIYYEFLVHPPSTAEDAVTWTFGIVPFYNEFSQATPQALTRATRGVLHGVGDYTRNGLVSGLGVTVSGSPDAIVHSAAGHWVHKGILYGDIPRDHTLNQNDSVPSALTSGQHYWAVISRNAGSFTVTKGIRGTSPAKPSMPAGEIFVRYVKVDYQGGGTSIIEAADLDGTTLYDRYLAVDGGGLNLTIHSGQAIGGSTWRYAGGTQTVALTDATTNYVWQLASGLFTDNTSTTPPETTALLMWKVVTSGGAISSITDWRTYADREVVLHLRDDLPVSVGEVRSLVIEHERLFIERINYRISDNGGTSGQTKLDTKLNGTTIYTSNATSDQRPTFAHDAVTLTDSDGVHEVIEVRRGDVLSLVSLEYPGGGTPTWAEAYYVCRFP